MGWDRHELLWDGMGWDRKKCPMDKPGDYSRRQESKQQGLLDEILNYGQKAHEIYDNALHQRLEDNPMAHSRPTVLKLVKQHGECGSTDLRRYHARASKEPDCRSEATVSVYSDITISNVSEKLF